MTINDIRNEGFTVMNTISLVTDVASVVLPIVPAGVSHALRAAKYTSKATNMVDTASDSAKWINKATDWAKSLLKKSDNISCPIRNSFRADTTVVTSEGDKAIATLQIGDYVLAWNESDNTTGYYEIIATIHHTDQIVTELIIDGEWIETTPEHPFYVDGKGWVDAEDLEIGDEVRQADGTTGIVWLQWNVKKTQEMYNLTVDTAHTFFVGDGQWLVHNCNSTTLSSNLGGIVSDNLQAHHLIPCEYACHPLVNRAKKSGWDMDEAYNGILLPTNPQLAKKLDLPVHRGPHPGYSSVVGDLLDKYERLANKNSWTNDKAFTMLKNLAGTLESSIIKMGGNAWLK